MSEIQILLIKADRLKQKSVWDRHNIRIREDAKLHCFSFRTTGIYGSKESG